MERLWGYAGSRAARLASRAETEHLAGLMMLSYGADLSDATAIMLGGGTVAAAETLLLAHLAQQLTEQLDPKWKRHADQRHAGAPADVVSYRNRVTETFISGLEPFLREAITAEGLEYCRDAADEDLLSYTFFEHEEDQLDRVLRRLRREVGPRLANAQAAGHSAWESAGVHVHKSFIASHRYWSLSLEPSSYGYRFTEDVQP